MGKVETTDVDTNLKEEISGDTGTIRRTNISTVQLAAKAVRMKLFI